jgi:ATP-dependent Lon protease
MLTSKFHCSSERYGAISIKLEKGLMMKSYAVLPLRNTVLFPKQIIPIYIGRKQSLNLISDISISDDKEIIVVAQKDGTVEKPGEKDFYEFATFATVMKVFDMPDNSKSAIVKGIRRIKINKYVQKEPYFVADYIDINEHTSDTIEMDALCENLKTIFS